MWIHNGLISTNTTHFYFGAYLNLKTLKTKTIMNKVIWEM